MKHDIIHILIPDLRMLVTSNYILDLLLSLDTKQEQTYVISQNHLLNRRKKNRESKGTILAFATIVAILIIRQRSV